jgi:hypothetical protein
LHFNTGHVIGVVLAAYSQRHAFASETDANVNGGQPPIILLIDRVEKKTKKLGQVEGGRNQFA